MNRSEPNPSTIGFLIFNASTSRNMERYWQKCGTILQKMSTLKIGWRIVFRLAFFHEVVFGVLVLNLLFSRLFCPGTASVSSTNFRPDPRWQSNGNRNISQHVFSVAVESMLRIQTPNCWLALTNSESVRRPSRCQVMMGISIIYAAP